MVAATCEVGRMLSGRLGLPAHVAALFSHSGERWDGKGEPGLARAEDVPLPVRIVHVARSRPARRPRRSLGRRAPDALIRTGWRRWRSRLAIGARVWSGRRD